jgi:hypothetical protein
MLYKQMGIRLQRSVAEGNPKVKGPAGCSHVCKFSKEVVSDRPGIFAFLSSSERSQTIVYIYVAEVPSFYIRSYQSWAMPD